MRKILLAGIAVAASLAAANAAFADRLAEVQKRGNVRCSANIGSIPGFGELSADGQWKGFDIEMCRTLATAIFGTDENHINFVPISWAQRWPMLQSGELDVVIKQSGWTQSRDTELGFNLSMPYLIGAFQVLVQKDLNAQHITDLDGGSVCAPSGSTNERVIAAYAKAKNIELEVLTFNTNDELLATYYQKRCDGLVMTGPTLAVTRMNAKDPEQHVILPDIVSLEPQSWIVKEGDDNWFDLTNWVISALFYAEQEGITSENVDQMRKSPPNAEIGRVLGVSPGVGARLGLSDDWVYNVIKRHGNYSQIWERNIGMQSPFKLERGVNALWNQGGVHYPLVFD